MNKKSILPKTQRARKRDSSLQLNNIIIQSIQDKKGSEIICLDLRKINEAIANYFIVCHADNVNQVKAIADNIAEQVEVKTGEKPWHMEGYQNREWILVDYFDVVVHVFLDKKRKVYQLEDLWSDAKVKKLNSEEKKRKIKTKRKIKLKKVN